MKLAALLLASASFLSFAVSASAQEQLTDSSVPKVSSYYTKFESGSLSKSGGGCGSYGYACSYSTSILIPTSLAAAKYIAGLPQGGYLCEVYFSSKQPSLTTQSGSVSSVFAPALFCEPAGQ